MVGSSWAPGRCWWGPSAAPCACALFAPHPWYRSALFVKVLPCISRGRTEPASPLDAILLQLDPAVPSFESEV